MSRTSSAPSDPADPTGDEHGVLIGATISAGFGIAWSLWGASGLTVHWSLGWVVGAIGALVGIAVIALAMTGFGAARGGGGGAGSMFASRGYRIVVVAEIVAFFVGTQVLARTGHPELIVVWVATVVGVHLVVFGLLFWRGFALIGAVLVAGAVVGLVLSLGGGDPATVRAVTALVAAVDLLAAGAVAVAGVRSRRASAVSVP